MRGIRKNALSQHCDKDCEVFILITEAVDHPRVSYIVANEKIRI